MNKTKTLSLPKELNIYTFLLNEYSLDNYTIDGKQYTVLHTLVRNNTNVQTILNSSGKLYLTLFVKQFNKARIKELFKQITWLGLLLEYLHDAYTIAGMSSRFVSAYLNKETKYKPINEFAVNLPFSIIRGLMGLFKIIITYQNMYKTTDRKLALESFIRCYGNIIKAKQFVINNKDNYRDVIQNVLRNNKTEKDLNVVLSDGLTNLYKSETYKPTFVFTLTTDISLAFILSEAIVPIAMFIEYVYEKHEIEKVLEMLEKAHMLSQLENTSSTTQTILQLWYVVLRTMYELQKTEQYIRLVQIYTPQIIADFERANRYYKNALTERANYTTKQAVITYLFMPFIRLISILNSLYDENLKLFIETLPREMFNDTQTMIIKHYLIQALIANYVNVLVRVFHNLAENQENNNNTFDMFVFEQILRSIFTSTSTLQTLPYIEKALYTISNNSSLLLKLQERIKDDNSLFIIPFLLGEQIQNKEHKFVRKFNNYAGPYNVPIGYISWFAPEFKIPSHYTILQTDFAQFVPKIYLENIQKYLLYEKYFTIAVVK